MTAGPGGHLVNFSYHPDPQCPTHSLASPSPLPFSWEQLFLQIPTDINPRASDPRHNSLQTPGLLVFCPLHLSISFSTSTTSIPLTIGRLCSRSRSMRHNSTGLPCLKSGLWISFQAFSFLFFLEGVVLVVVGTTEPR